MCCEHLLRGEIPYMVTNTETGASQEYNYLGHWDHRKQNSPDLGFYTIGATGCGYMFYDGMVIHFESELYKFEYKKDPNRTFLCDAIDFQYLQNNKESIEKYLGQEKYQPVFDNIFIGLGIPSGFVESTTSSPKGKTWH